MRKKSKLLIVFTLVIVMILSVALTSCSTPNDSTNNDGSQTVTPNKPSNPDIDGEVNSPEGGDITPDEDSSNTNSDVTLKSLESVENKNILQLAVQKKYNINENIFENAFVSTYNDLQNLTKEGAKYEGYIISDLDGTINFASESALHNVEFYFNEVKTAGENKLLAIPFFAYVSDPEDFVTLIKNSSLINKYGDIKIIKGFVTFDYLVKAVYDYTKFPTETENGLTFNKGDRSVLLWAEKGIKQANLPKTVSTIYSHAFYKCNKLQSITIGSNVTNISSEAFKDCPQLIISCDMTSKPVLWKDNWNSNIITVFKGETAPTRDYNFYVNEEKLVNLAKNIKLLTNEDINANSVLVGTFNEIENLTKDKASDIKDYVVKDNLFINFTENESLKAYQYIWIVDSVNKEVKPLPYGVYGEDLTAFTKLEADKLNKYGKIIKLGNFAYFEYFTRAYVDLLSIPTEEKDGFVFLEGDNTIIMYYNGTVTNDVIVIPETVTTICTGAFILKNAKYQINTNVVNIHNEAFVTGATAEITIEYQIKPDGFAEDWCGDNIVNWKAYEVIEIQEPEQTEPEQTEPEQQK